METFERIQATGRVEAASLAEIQALPLPARSTYLLQFGHVEIQSALHSIRDLPALDPERLSWALAFNVTGPQPHAPARRATRGYLDRWPPDTPWATIWDSFNKPLSHAGDGPPTLLSDLAVSVACEHREDWQSPSARPVDKAQADRAFEFVYARDRSKVAGDILATFGNRAGDPQAIANEAWARVYCDYWSVQARRRFLGLCRIATLACQVARHIAGGAIRDLQNHADPLDAHPALLDLGVPDLTEAAIAGQLARSVQECVRRLPGRQQIVATMIWFRQIPAIRVAEILRISEPAVSQHLKHARSAVRACLNARGLRPRDDARGKL